ncbi:MAG: GerMN domain-containing protein [Lachnospiraceae bacterium]|nr:GerMN domain-containing protein [Lachnospiraceae bacterium]
MKRLLYGILLVLWTVFLGSCSGETTESEAGRYSIYYLEPDGTGFIKEEYEIKSQPRDTVGILTELLEQLHTGVREGAGIPPIESAIEVTDFQIQETQLSVYFSAAYQNINGLDEILSRAAIVKTLCQVSGIDYVEFYVEDQPLMLSGKAVGLMNSDSFIDNLNEREREQSKQVTLYFSDESGQQLVEVYTELTYDAAQPLARLLVEKLIAGPERIENLNVSALLPTVPPNTVVNSITIRDNICYVDVSREFMELLTNVKSDIVVYSIVNTLCELSNVNRVQFSIEGEQQEKYGETTGFNAPFERNLDLVVAGTGAEG